MSSLTGSYCEMFGKNVIFHFKILCKKKWKRVKKVTPLTNGVIILGGLRSVAWLPPSLVVLTWPKIEIPLFIIHVYRLEMIRIWF